MSDYSPTDLGTGGQALWDAMLEDHDLDIAQRMQLTEACRAKDRLDRLDLLLQGETETWCRVYPTADGDVELKVDAALTQANATANLMKQLIAALRLPDEKTGKKPQRRGPRGAQAPSVPGGSKVSSLDRKRAAKSG